jgi:1-acyl-sn-glycerol-3-phosphate acyltransferase
MSLSHALTALFFKALTGAMFRVDARELKKVPEHGPLILVMNHVHIPEIPTLYTRLLPRRVHGMALAERVNGKDIVGRILRLFGTIPIHRREADIDALRAGIDALTRGDMILLDPEGTRSHDGRLQKGQPGAVLMALHSGAPLQPVVHYGSEGYASSLKRLRRSPLRFVVGRPFRLDAGPRRVTSQARQEMTDEVMYQMAALLPPQYRGVYANLSLATTQYLVF